MVGGSGGYPPPDRRTSPHPGRDSVAAVVERKTKGTVIAAIQSYASTRFGADGRERLLSALEPEDASTLRSVVPIGWYPTGLTMRTLDALRATFAPEAPNLLGDYGVYAAESDLTVFHRVFLRMANPAFVIEKTGEYWSRFHTHGHWVVERTHPSGMIATLRDFEGARVYCDALTPYIRRMLELVGARTVRSSHAECGHRGAGACVFVADWR